MKNILIGFLGAIAIVASMGQVFQPGVPSGAVFYMTTGTCPTGYTENTSVRGRMVVGLPAAGTNAGTVASAFTDLEARTHTHTVPALTLPAGGTLTTGNESGGHVHGQGAVGSGADVTGGESATHTHNVTGNNGGSTGTGTSGATTAATPYIQYITCTKS